MDLCDFHSSKNNYLVALRVHPDSDQDYKDYLATLRVHPAVTVYFLGFYAGLYSGEDTSLFVHAICNCAKEDLTLNENAKYVLRMCFEDKKVFDETGSIMPDEIDGSIEISVITRWTLVPLLLETSYGGCFGEFFKRQEVKEFVRLFSEKGFDNDYGALFYDLNKLSSATLLAAHINGDSDFDALNGHLREILGGLRGLKDEEVDEKSVVNLVNPRVKRVTKVQTKKTKGARRRVLSCTKCNEQASPDLQTASCNGPTPQELRDLGNVCRACGNPFFAEEYVYV